jgi:hypothetical protein
VTATPLFPVAAADVALTNDEWYTPRWLFDAAGLVFDLDVCAPVDPMFRTCPAREYLTVLDDGLTAPWTGTVWMNPPFRRPSPWAARFAAHGDGLALIPAARSAWLGDLLRAADSICLLGMGDGFVRPDGSRANYPISCVLVAIGPTAIAALPRVATADPWTRGAYHVAPGQPA